MARMPTSLGRESEGWVLVPLTWTPLVRTPLVAVISVAGERGKRAKRRDERGEGEGKMGGGDEVL